MSDGMVAVQARVAEIQAMLGVRMSGPATTSSSSAASTASTSSADFAMALQSALTDGTLGSSDGSSSSTLDKLSALMAQLNGTAKSGSGTGGTAGSSGVSGTSGTSGASGTSAPTPAPSPAPTPDVGARAVSLAASYTGVKYQWGGEDPATGVDCSGLTQLVYGQLGISLPRVAADQARVGTAVASLSQAQPGDLVFFGSPIHHVGIYAGDGKMIDAPRTGKTVGLHPLWGTPDAIRRVAPAGATGQTGQTGQTGTIGAPPVGAASTVAAADSGAALDGPYAAAFTSAGERYGVDPALLSAVAKAESAYNPRAVSSAGAQGLMQLMPATARSLGVDAFDPKDAIDGAARLLSGLLRDFGGRTDLAVAAYNAGPGAVRRYGGIPPYAETQTYVKRVTQNWEALR